MIYSMQSRTITITAGSGGQIQVFHNGTDLGYFRGTKYITANDGDNISVWCDADPGSSFINLCITGTQTCTTDRPFNFVVNMDISMTATFMSCSSQQDNTLLINGKAGKIVVTPGTPLVATIRNTSSTVQACPVPSTWGVIARSGPLGQEQRVDTGTNVIDSNGCGTINLTLNVEGTYTLVGRICCAWNPLSGNVHCVETDGDTNNIVTVVVSSAPQTGCDPTVCSSLTNICVLNQLCVPKTIIFVGAAALIYLMVK